MKRDLELIRKILFKIEEEYIATALIDLNVDGDYSVESVAYHCKLLHEAGFVDSFSQRFADDKIYIFSVGGLTWNGHEFLDKIRQDTVWNKTKEVIKKKGLPMIFDVVKDVATGIISSMTEGAVKGLISSP